ncbi:unnamed protein product [Prorocentrum cordatum]|uniref:Glycosyl hydrolase family 13 catalytic domain-containing protein n=1 Tax=Prorocentrum cordatum TaxID=2364126 RepID=A0ABN9Q2U5_9DINO|nr:unnamed protein product [Polarella glacialis]
MIFLFAVLLGSPGTAASGAAGPGLAEPTRACEACLLSRPVAGEMREEDEASLLQRGAASLAVAGPEASGEEAQEFLQGSRHSSIAGKSIYLIMIDRFAREGGYSAGDDSKCSGSNWCNGTLRGITLHLPYIKRMGFDCIWVTPPIKNFDGYDGQSGYGYAGYWAEDLYDIDPHFGTKIDLKELVRETHRHGMCFILDIVLNHVRPIHSVADLAVVHPFNETGYFHQLGIGNSTFDEYSAKKSSWPPPTQALSVGASCAVRVGMDGKKDWTNGGNYCNNFNPSDVFNESTYLGEDAPGPNTLSYCGPGNFDCKGYNVTSTLEGWFYDLADLNQSVPFVRESLKEWAAWMATEYDIDGARLDTAPFMPHHFLFEVQEHLRSLQKPIDIEDVTTTNVSFHASFQLQGGGPVLAGMENFPLAYLATAGYCGWPRSPSSPIAMKNLSYLSAATKTQLESGLYSHPDLLMNFMDSQDDTPVAGLFAVPPKDDDPFGGGMGTGGCIDSPTLVRNALTWAMLARGMPVITWGDEQGNTENRNSLWQHGWKTTTWQYQFIKSLNRIRSEHGLGLKGADVVHASADTFVFKRGRADCAETVWIYTNNMETDESRLVEYPGVPRMVLPGGKIWVDAITGKRARLSGGRLVAEGTEPQVLVARARS